MLGAGGVLAALPPGALWIDMSTSSPAVAERVRARGAQNDLRVVDAPVAGMSTGADAGTLEIFVGGDARRRGAGSPDPRAPRRPRAIFHVGGNGAGLRGQARRDEVMTYLKGLQDRYGFGLLDRSDLATFGGDPDEFYDGFHMKRANARKLTRSVVASCPPRSRTPPRRSREARPRRAAPRARVLIPAGPLVESDDVATATASSQTAQHRAQRPRYVRARVFCLSEIAIRRPCEEDGMEVEIGRGKKGRRAYGFDDIAIVPSRRTRDAEDVDITWKLGAAHARAAVPRLGHGRRGRSRVRRHHGQARRPRRAQPRGRADALRERRRAARPHRRRCPRSRRRARCRRSTRSPSSPSSSPGASRRSRTAACWPPPRSRRSACEEYYQIALEAGLDVLVIQGTVVSAEHVEHQGRAARPQEVHRRVPGAGDRRRRGQLRHHAAPHAHRRRGRARRRRPGPRLHHARRARHRRAAGHGHRRRRRGARAARARDRASTATSSPTAACAPAATSARPSPSAPTPS